MKKIVVLVAFAAFAACTAASAQTWPSRPITLVVPFPPGGSTDVTARILGEHMRQALGQPVLIENVGGAGGSIGVGRVARAAPDGYTIDIGQWDTHVANGVVYQLTTTCRRISSRSALCPSIRSSFSAAKDFPPTISRVSSPG